MTGSLGLFLTISAAALAQDFQKDVLPVLAKRCQACHGSQQQMAGLRFDKSDPSIARSAAKIVERITSDKKGFRMPPVGAPLEAVEVASLRKWIEAGANWPSGVVASSAKPSHWAFQKPVKPAQGNGVDHFINVRLKAENVEPSLQADRRTLYRRLSLDLTGLIPAAADVEAFVNDKRADAYERAVDRLLASPHYGERWARYWLDLAHYADSDGYEKDLPRPNAWRYRHWVIDAMNRDMPFDQFTREQLAGDLIPNATVEQKVATGFLRAVLTNREGGVDRAEARFEQLVNRTATVSTVWLGLTVGCAQCHNHKYDPISHKDYYGMMAFFENGEDAEIDAPVGGEAGPYLAALPAYREKRDAIYQQYKVAERAQRFEDKLREANQNPGKDLEWDFALTAFKALFDRCDKYLTEAKHTARDLESFRRYFVVNVGSSPDTRKEKTLSDEMKEARGKLNDLDKTLPPFGQAMVIEADASYGPTHLRKGGDYKAKAEAIPPATLSILPPMTADLPRNRLGLAEWLVSRENPLTARVAMNRLWQELMGRGLVKTSEDFGVVGDKPTHPELLDWLAVEFMDQGWSWKRMVRTVVLSDAYRRSSNARPDLATKDPENTLFARQNRTRMSAELIRDAALSGSGLLNDAIGGRSVKPPQPKGVAELGYGGRKWDETQGAERYRRGLYVHYQRTTPYPLLATFDAPDSSIACSRRRVSNTALQALNLLNDPVFFEASQALAARILRETQGQTLAARIQHAYQLCLSRPATSRESERITQLYTQLTAKLDDKTAVEWMPAPPEGVTTREAAAWTGIGRVLLNLDEFITKE
ncbi:chromosome segregation protein [Bryobacterales bacterium F-183]|nr:chromosome segregation protein [Bryobacterales bacterium F-183]